MLRVSKRNSQEDQSESDLNDLQRDLERCGHDSERLNSLRDKLETNLKLGSHRNMKEEKSKGNTITAVVDQFQEIKELKQLFKSVETDISSLVGEETRVLVATRKGKSVANNVVKNRSLCEPETIQSETQQCRARKCQSCNLLKNKKGDVMMVNKTSVKTPDRELNCKTRNCIYLAQCSVCDDSVSVENAYVGQTQQRMHQRINGHRSCFVQNDPDTIEKSALALHASEHHSNNFNLDIFKFMIMDRANPCSLNKRESRAIGELRTNVIGLNRMKIQK